MNLRHLTCIALAGAGALAAPGAFAQRIGSGQAPRQVATPRSSLPNPAGLTPPMAPSLTPPMAPSLAPPGAPDLSRGTPAGSPVVDPGVAEPLAPSGVAAVQSGGSSGANAMGFGGMPRGPYSAVDIERNFQQADINHDGELSRAEAQRLAIPVPFDDLDRNHDGVLTHFEYQDFFQ